MRNLSISLRTLRSKRALVALGGIAAISFGIVNTVGTQAATQDTGIATASQIASQNYYPVPVSSSMSCSGSGSKVNLSWTAVPGVKYSVEEWRNNNQWIWTGVQTGNTYNGWYGGSGGGTATNDRVRIYSINLVTGEKSTGYVSYSTYNPTIFGTTCSSYFPPEGITCWQQQASWTPGQNISDCSGGTVDPQNLVAPQQQAMRAPVTTTTDPSTTTTTTTDPTSTSSSTTSSPTTTTSTTTSPTTTTTTAPKTTSTTPTTTTSSSTTTVPTTTSSSTTTASPSAGQ